MVTVELRCDSRGGATPTLEDIMWNPTARSQHSRAGLRYGSDMTDAEWAIVPPLLPKPSDRGRRRRWEWREVLDAIFYVIRSGCPWRFLPDSFHPGVPSIVGLASYATLAGSRI